MNYLQRLKLYEDMRVPNREAFKMEQIYNFNLGGYIHLYDYELCMQLSDEEEYSDHEEQKPCFSE